MSMSTAPSLNAVNVPSAMTFKCNACCILQRVQTVIHCPQTPPSRRQHQILLYTAPSPLQWQVAQALMFPAPHHRFSSYFQVLRGF
ncbi:hypothetical protein BDR04DRAFT_49436 [Suillus decipiens]|nr:hypothetical protein BDR04DRAFT_49436 [Suillus decipiens]